MVFQPADESHGALSEPLDGLLEIRQSAASLALGVLVPLNEGLRFAFAPGLVADAGLSENLLFHEGHQVVG
jgi:hypothetical protein